MSQRAYRTFQALILAALGLFVLLKASDGDLLEYINQRLVLIAALAAVGFLALAQVALRERSVSDPEQGSHSRVWGLWLLALPVLFGLLAPDLPLGARSLERQGVSLQAGLTAQPDRAALDAIGIPPMQRTILDWIRISRQGALSPGVMADIDGFVVHDPRLADDELIVTRYSVTGSVVDAVAVGMVVKWPEAASFPEGTWVRARGPVDRFVLEGLSLPVLAAQQVDQIPEPEQSYLFP